MLRLTARKAFTHLASESKHLTPALGISATSRIRNQLSAAQTSKMQKRFHSNTVYLSDERLKPGYQIMRNRLHDVMTHAAIAAAVSPGISGLWMLFTEQTLSESPVAIAALGVGGCIIADRLMQAYRVKKYTKLSVQVDPAGPAKSEEDNKKILEIMAGDNPSVKFGTSGVTVSGPVGNTENPSNNNAITKVHSMKRIVIPTCVLTSRADRLVNHVHDRWLARINFPLAILNIMAILGKKDEDRRADDYVVLASSIASIGDFLTGDSVKEARDKVTQALSNCRTPQDVLTVLIDNQVLDEGGMSFLKEWVKNQETLALRVGRTGSPVFYKDRTFSFGGPYPMHLFPEKVHATETKEEMASNAKRMSK